MKELWREQTGSYKITCTNPGMDGAGEDWEEGWNLSEIIVVIFADLKKQS